MEPAEGAADQDFFQRTESSHIDPGLAKISQLASRNKQTAAETGEHGVNDDAKETAARKEDDITVTEKKRHTPRNKAHKRKRQESSSSQESSSQEDVSLQGRMVQHPHNSTEQIMVLVDPRGNVYSAMERTTTGERVRMGTLQQGEIVWNDDAFSKNGKLSCVVISRGCMFRSRRSLPLSWQASVKYHARSTLDPLQLDVRMIAKLSSGQKVHFGVKALFVHV